ncbi:MAG: tail fiber domain-containing protein, partial [Planctomycetes bacterium]|nr:tail fiber domain-containing protein [Planctomycetota bacterium]
GSSTTAMYATVAGGLSNTAGATSATVSGGSQNQATGNGATVGGGGPNLANGALATISGGGANGAGAEGATVAGGGNNTASGQYAIVAGGRSNTAEGDYSFAAGRHARANLDRSFVWAYHDTTDHWAQADDTFNIYADEGLYVEANSGSRAAGYFYNAYGAAGSTALQAFSSYGPAVVVDSTSGVALVVTRGDGTGEAARFWGDIRIMDMPYGFGHNVVIDSDGYLRKDASSRRYKKNIVPAVFDREAVLKLQPVRFDWRTSGESDIGLIAEDVAEILPELVMCDSSGAPDAVRYDKVALYLVSVAKAQGEQLAAQQEQIATQRDEISDLRARLEQLETLVAGLADTTKGGAR